MKKLALILFIYLGTTTLLLAQDWNRLRDDYLREFDPSGFAVLKTAENVKQQGLNMANNLYQSLQNFQRLSNTMDPDALLTEFNQQMREIESLQANFKSQSSSYDFNTGMDIGNSFSNGNVEQGLGQFSGWLSNRSEQKKAKQELQAKKDALNRQRQNQMSQIYWKAQDYNEQTKQEYIRAAAYAESLSEEKYHLGFVENLNCFSRNMKATFSSLNSNWLNNTCPKPLKNNFNAITNNFVAKDVQYANLSARKFMTYTKTQYNQYKQAAVAFMAAAAKTKPSAKYFYQLGTYYAGQSTLLALSNYMTAEAYDPNFFNSEQQLKYNHMKREAEAEIKAAIETGNQNFLSAFLSSGLNQIVQINGRSILQYAIQSDQPDAVQVILNKQIESKTQKEVQNALYKTIMLATINDSYKTIQRFIDLGVGIDFEFKGHSPIDIAEKVNAQKAFNLLLENTTRLDFYKQKYRNSSTLQKKEFENYLNTKNYQAINVLIQGIENQEVKAELMDKLLNVFYRSPEHLPLLEYFPEYKTSISRDASIQKQYEDLFLFHFFFNLNSAYHYLVENDIVDVYQIDINKTRISEIHENAYRRIYAELASVNLSSGDSRFQFEDVDKFLNKLKSKKEQVLPKLDFDLLNNKNLNNLESFMSNVSSSTRRLQNDPNSMLHKYAYFLSWQDVFMINQSYDFFWIKASGKKKNRYLKGDALWNENTETWQEQYQNVSKFINGNPWDLNAVEMKSVSGFNLKLKPKRIDIEVMIKKKNKAIIFGLPAHLIKKRSNKKFNELKKEISHSSFYNSVQKSYSYYSDNATERNMMNKSYDIPTHVFELIMRNQANSLVLLSVLKKDHKLLTLLDEKESINWNEQINGQALFLYLVQMMDWEFINIISADYELDLSQTDPIGNSLFHYLGQYYWAYNMMNDIPSRTPDVILPNIFNKGFDKNILSMKNKNGRDAWYIFSESRYTWNYVKDLKKNYEAYFKSKKKGGGLLKKIKLPFGKKKDS